MRTQKHRFYLIKTSLNEQLKTKPMADAYRCLHLKSTQVVCNPGKIYDFGLQLYDFYRIIVNLFI
jgi:hypothetical protein